jgi:hypothetical protein
LAKPGFVTPQLLFVIVFRFNCYYRLNITPFAQNRISKNPSCPLLE